MKAFERAARVSMIKVINLRRIEPQSDAASVLSSPVDWSCRWIVDGHWRRQWHPSLNRHELTYIEPYIKGPEDRPLRITDGKVYSVSR